MSTFSVSQVINIANLEFLENIALILPELQNDSRNNFQVHCKFISNSIVCI